MFGKFSVWVERQSEKETVSRRVRIGIFLLAISGCNLPLIISLANLAALVARSRLRIEVEPG